MEELIIPKDVVRHSITVGDHPVSILQMIPENGNNKDALT
jgi:hypothetical protein